jgi:hypothetical protein
MADPGPIAHAERTSGAAAGGQPCDTSAWMGGRGQAYP